MEMNYVTALARADELRLASRRALDLSTQGTVNERMFAMSTATALVSEANFVLLRAMVLLLADMPTGGA